MRQPGMLRPSQRPANVAYYARNRDAEIARVRLRQAATLAFLRELRRVPCADCGAVLEPHQMDFDHRDPAEKNFQVTDGRAMLMSRVRLIAEVEKCDVVCANCHRVRTWLAHRKRASLGPSTARSRYIERLRRRWRTHARMLDDLRDVPSADCHRRFLPCAMDFDHREPATKIAGVTRLIGRAGTERLLAEAAKCDIVCANCHRVRTYSRRAARLTERE
jgi:formate-dependent nitrite reductase cytochrome c552 subunit